MKKITYTKRTDEELREDLATKRMALHSFRFSTRGAKAKNVKEGKTTRKDIARILTEKRSREIALQNEKNS